MSEKTQHTRARTQALMARHYGDEFHHKHDKSHSFRRQHWPSHPNKIMRNQEQLGAIKTPTDSFRTPMKEKPLKRLAKVPFH